MSKQISDYYFWAEVVNWKGSQGGDVKAVFYRFMS
jgi:hypothetical protein